MSDTESQNITIKEDIIESSNELSGDEGESTKTIQKPKKPRTEAQKKALEKAQETRRRKAEERKQLEKDYMEDSEYFKRLTPAQRKHLKEMAIEKPKPQVVESNPTGKRGKKTKVIYEDDSDSDEEVVIVKRKPSKKKPTKKVIYKDESSSEDEHIVKQIQKPKPIPQNPQEEYSEDEYDYSPPEHSYTYRQPLTYSSIARFL